MLTEFFNLQRIPLCERIVWPHDQHEFILQYGEGFEVVVYGFKCQHAEIHISIQDLTGQTFRYMAKDFDLHVWMLFSIFQNEMRQEIKRRAFVGSNADAPPLQRT